MKDNGSLGAGWVLQLLLIFYWGFVAQDPKHVLVNKQKKFIPLMFGFTIE